MSRIRTLIALTAVTATAVTGVAAAAPSARHVTGGTTSLTLSSAAVSALTQNGLKVSALSPATASGSTLTLPISGGHLNARLHGTITHRGGLAITNGTTTVRVRRLIINRSASGTYIRARVARYVHRGAHHMVVSYHDARLARVTAIKLNAARTEATGTVRLSRAAATLINRLAGHHIASSGTPIGTVTVAPVLS